jgi:hypothetical protein
VAAADVEEEGCEDDEGRERATGHPAKVRATLGRSFTLRAASSDPKENDG